MWCTENCPKAIVHNYMTFMQVPEIREQLVKENQGKWDKIAKYQKKAFFSPSAQDIKKQAKM